ncbi:Caspase 9 [Mactra antiquata]
MYILDTLKMDSYLNNKKDYRGIALVIGIEKFDQREDQGNIDRKCCQADIKMMNSMFEKLDFFVECFKDLTAKQIREKVLKASKDPRNEKCQCFVLVISTHGREINDKKEGLWHHVVMGSDRERVMVEELLEMFDGQKARGLNGKAKMFFIQACRIKDIMNPSQYHGNDEGFYADVTDSASSVYEEEHIYEFEDEDFNDNCDDIYKEWERDVKCWDPVGKKTPGSQEGPTGDSDSSPDINALPPEPLDVLRVKCPKDCLIYYSAESGYKAFKSEDGSDLFRCMFRQFPKLLRGRNIITYLTYVNMALSLSEFIFDDNYSEDNYSKVTASYLTKMNKQVVFQPLNEKSRMAKARRIIYQKD